MVDSDELERRIRERAYRIWEDEGRPEGKYLDHWLRAQVEILEELEITKGHHKFKSEE